MLIRLRPKGEFWVEDYVFQGPEMGKVFYVEYRDGKATGSMNWKKPADAVVKKRRGPMPAVQVIPPSGGEDKESLEPEVVWPQEKPEEYKREPPRQVDPERYNREQKAYKTPSGETRYKKPSGKPRKFCIWSEVEVCWKWEHLPNRTMLFREPNEGKPKNSSRGNRIVWDEFQGCWKESFNKAYGGQKRPTGGTGTGIPARYKRHENREFVVKQARIEYDNRIARGEDGGDLAEIIKSKIEHKVNMNVEKYGSSRCFECIACMRPECGKCVFCREGNREKAKIGCRECLCLDPYVAGEDGKPVRAERDEDVDGDEVMSLSDVEGMQTSDVEEGEEFEEDTGDVGEELGRVGDTDTDTDRNRDGGGEVGDVEKEMAPLGDGNSLLSAPLASRDDREHKGIDDAFDALDDDDDDDADDDDMLANMDDDDDEEDGGDAEAFLRMRQQDEAHVFEDDDDDDGEGGDEYEDDGPAWKG